MACKRVRLELLAVNVCQKNNKNFSPKLWAGNNTYGKPDIMNTSKRKRGKIYWHLYKLLRLLRNVHY